MAKVPSRTSMSSLAASSGPRTSNNRVHIQEPPAAVATQLTRPQRRQSMTQTPPQPISHSQAADDSTDTLENHSVCLKTVKDLECYLHKVEAERDRLLQENGTLRQQLSQAQDAQSAGRTWEDVQRAVHGAQEALNTCHQQLISCMTNAANPGVPSTTLPGSTAGPDSMWASQDEGLGVLNPQMFFDV
ncbi:hypothetical protein ASPCAL14877 [Aspergillus calidoustus]|uniref:Uncharacterized protein n=1 Tax=Aspergillus calidoustus TaxID=454130 RepID=A0A0U4ZR04_ASPCI|nr:hypothetical protein ASPCAL14877 [Aspergillus calidoustus]